MSAAANPEAPAFTRTGPGWRYRVESMPVRRLQNFGVGALVVAAAGTVQAVNMTAAPGGSTAEGSLMARAWALDEGSFTSRATDWYDHPPLGWMLTSIWTSVTSAFGRAPNAIGAGRELMLLAAIPSAGLVWVLARRLGSVRWSAALGLAVFALSPLAVHLHRQVTLANLAVPFVLAAFALASNPRRPLVAYAGSGACLAAAVLTHEMSLLFLPLLAWHLDRSSLPSTRRYALAVSGTLFLLVVAAYVVPVTLAGELTAGEGHGGLLAGIVHRLSDPAGDRAGTALLTFFLPAAALGAVALAQTAWHRRETAQRTTAPLLVVAGVAATAVAGWWIVEHRLVAPEETGSRTATATGAGRPLAVTGAEEWVRGNLAGSSVRLVVDDADWVDLLDTGLLPAQMTAVSTMDLPDDVAPAVDGWADHEVVVATPEVRERAGGDADARAALRDAVVLATFGTGEDRVDVVRIGVSPDAAGHDGDIAAHQGLQVAQNPSITMDSEVRRVITGGRVDQRLTTTLVALAVDRPLEVTGFPADPAEVAAGAPRRIVELRFAPAGDAETAAHVLRSQQDPYQPSDIHVGTDGQMTVTFPPAPLS